MIPIFSISDDVDFGRLVDSMQVDSGTVIATLEIDRFKVYVEVEGEVRVHYNEDPSVDVRESDDYDVYRDPSNFPDGLMKFFNGSFNYAMQPKNVQVWDNNWFELCVEKDGELLWSDCVEMDSCTPKDFFDLLWDTYKEWSRPVAEPGSVIHATLRSKDLIPAFLDRLSSLDFHRANDFKNARPALRDALYKLADGLEDDLYWDSEEATEDCNDLQDVLDEFAPAGHYFGAHPGDGSDFGYWKIID